jgi:hypothetical protein
MLASRNGYFDIVFIIMATLIILTLTYKVTAKNIYN